METTIWILKGVIALIFTLTGVSKILLPKEKLLEKGMNGLINLDEEQIKLAGSLEIMGAIGLVLPTLLNVYPIVSGIAALCLGLTMIVASWIHYKLKLSILPNIAILIICLVIAYWELM